MSAYTPNPRTSTGWFWARSVTRYKNNTQIHGPKQVVMVDRDHKGQLVVFTARANGIEQPMRDFVWGRKIANLDTSFTRVDTKEN